MKLSETLYSFFNFHSQYTKLQISIDYQAQGPHSLIDMTGTTEKFFWVRNFSLKVFLGLGFMPGFFQVAKKGQDFFSYCYLEQCLHEWF